VEKEAQGSSVEKEAQGSSVEREAQGSLVEKDAAAVRRLRVEVLATYPHDTGAYTQGLLVQPGDPGTLLESTGRYGHSELRRVDLASGQPMRRVQLPDALFGEGLALVPGSGGTGDRLVQLTWRGEIALEWDAATFARRGDHRYAGEGWGLCYDAGGDRLVMSDGSDRLTFRDPRTFAETGSVTVTYGGRPVASLNELECVGGRVWANLYGSEILAEIDPESGHLVALVDARGLLDAAERAGTDVLNGIAYDPSDGTYLITGKLWPKLFRVRFVAAGPER